MVCMIHVSAKYFMQMSTISVLTKCNYDLVCFAMFCFLNQLLETKICLYFQVIPALSAFCAYAALGILGLYGLVSTFFVACLTLDQRRVEQSRDAILFCYVHRDYVPNKFSQMNLIQSFIEKVYAPTLMKLSCKVGYCLILKIKKKKKKSSKIITLTVSKMEKFSFTVQ